MFIKKKKGKSLTSLKKMGIKQKCCVSISFLAKDVVCVEH